MMDYRHRDYCDKQQKQKDYDLEVAYELGADYQKDLMDHARQLQERKKRRNQNRIRKGQ